MSAIYTGFSEPEHFMQAVATTQLVNYDVSRKPGKTGEYGLRTDSTIVTFSQARPMGDGAIEVLYFQAVVDHYRVMAGSIMDDRNHTQMADQVREAAIQFLTDHGQKHREALIAAPDNLILLNGNATFLDYSKELGYTYNGETGKKISAALNEVSGKTERQP